MRLFKWNKTAIADLMTICEESKTPQLGFVNFSRKYGNSVGSASSKYYETLKKSTDPKKYVMDISEVVKRRDTITMDIKEYSVDLNNKKITIVF